MIATGQQGQRIHPLRQGVRKVISPVPPININPYEP